MAYSNDAENVRDYSLLFTTGDNDNVQITDDSTIQNVFDGGGAVSFWFRAVTAGQSNVGRIIEKTHTGFVNGWGCLFSDASGSLVRVGFVEWFDGGIGHWRTDRNLSLNTWYHFTAVYDADSATNDPVFYINGSSVAVTELTTPSGTRQSDATADLFFGNRSDFAADMDGYLDDVQVYDNTLSAAQVLAIYNGTAQSGLVGRWNFDEGSGTSALDTSTNSNTGTITGADYTQFFNDTENAATAFSNDTENAAVGFSSDSENAADSFSNDAENAAVSYVNDTEN